MKSLWSRSGRHLAGAWAAAVTVLVGCEALGQSKPERNNPDLVIRVDETVEIEFANNRINLYPKVALIKRGAELEFVVKKLPKDHTLEIDYKVEKAMILGEPGSACDPTGGTPAEKSVKGPFARYQEELRGRLTFVGGADTVTRKLTYDVCHRDAIVWKYEVALRDKKGKDLDVLDPMTVGKGEGN